MDINAWNWPQWLYVGLTLAGLLLCANTHGKPKTGKHNFWSTIFASSLMWVCLYFGGFFK